MSDLDEHDGLHRLLGGYLLGGLDEADTDRLDGHLHDCADCRAELDRLAPVPELLQRLPQAQQLTGAGVPLAVGPAARPSPANIEKLLSRMRAEKTRETRVSRVRWLAAASVATITAAAVGWGVLTGGGGGQQDPPEALPSVQMATARFQPAPGSGMGGEAVLTAKGWGVSVSLDMTELTGKAPFYCQMRSKSGVTEQVAVWGATTSGDAEVTGASSIKITDVASLTILDKDGKIMGTAEVV